MVDHGLGFEPDATVAVIRAVGNYGDIYAAHVGPDSALQIESARARPTPGTDGGLLLTTVPLIGGH